MEIETHALVTTARNGLNRNFRCETREIGLVEREKRKWRMKDEGEMEKERLLR